MFDASLKDREQSFDSAPGTTMFLHWLVGMVYVFYFASFILLLREVTEHTQQLAVMKNSIVKMLFTVHTFVCDQVLRPGVLWFLRNLNDPDFNPVQEMIHLPIYRHLRRFILSVVSKKKVRILKLANVIWAFHSLSHWNTGSCGFLFTSVCFLFQVVFGSIVLLMLWLPIRIIKLLFPAFLPYNVMLYRCVGTKWCLNRCSFLVRVKKNQPVCFFYTCIIKSRLGNLFSVLLLQWCSSQRVVPGTPAASGRSACVIGARSHSPVAQTSCPRLDVHSWICAVGFILITP